MYMYIRDRVYIYFMFLLKGVGMTGVEIVAGQTHFLGG